MSVHYGSHVWSRLHIRVIEVQLEREAGRDSQGFVIDIIELRQRELKECLVLIRKEPGRSARAFGGDDAMLNGIAREIRSGP